MATATTSVTRKQRASGDGPSYVIHPSFQQPGAEGQYDFQQERPMTFPGGHMPDEVTLSFAFTTPVDLGAIRAAVTAEPAIGELP